MSSLFSREERPNLYGGDAFRNALVAAEAGDYDRALALTDDIVANPDAHSWEAAYLAAWLRVRALTEDLPDPGNQRRPPHPPRPLRSKNTAASSGDETPADPAPPLDAVALEDAARLLESAVSRAHLSSRWPRVLLARVREEQGDHLEAARHLLLDHASNASNTSSLVSCIQALGAVFSHMETLDADALVRGVDALVEAVTASALPEAIVPEVCAELYIAGAQRLATMRRFDQADHMLRQAELAEPKAGLLNVLGHPARVGEIAESPLPLAGVEIEGSLVERVFEILDVMTSKKSVSATTARPAALLLFGPSGTGKTHIVRAYASRQGAEFAYRKIRLDQIFGRYVGESEKAISDVMREIGSASGGGLLFVDELDAVGTGRDLGGEVWRSTFVGHFLEEVDHFKESARGAALVGGTNRIWGLDHAVLRRFDHIVLTPLPNESERRDLFRLLTTTAGIELPGDDLEELVAASAHMTPADCTTAFSNVLARDEHAAPTELVRRVRRALEERGAANHLARWITLSREKLVSEGFEHLLTDFDRHYGSIESDLPVRLSARRPSSLSPSGTHHLRYISNRVR
jgi:hypothetical protein